MAPDAQLAAGGETIELQQQVARLQALLEASRQVHSTIREEEVLEQVLRIVVRELEMAGAAFPGTGLGLWRRRRPTADGAAADAAAHLSAGGPRRPQDDRAGGGVSRTAASSRSTRPTSSKAWRCRPPWRSKTRAITSATWSLRACSRIWTRRGRFSARCCRRSCPRFPATRWPSAPTPATRWAATISTSWSSPTAAC